MGNCSSRAIEIGRQLENAIRFDIPQVVFDYDVSECLKLIKPELEKRGYSIYWSVEFIPDPNGGGNLVETTYNTGGMSNNVYPINHSLVNTHFNPSCRTRTIVVIKNINELKTFDKIPWQTIIKAK